ncbi:hypothetical protein [Sphingomonas sp.]|jgi:hypothetical protein|uniref:hypothetical protein n=1 Tax=Sphingomonas sp. TaxID=28214 RepID=UPI002ED7F0B4
MKNRTPVRSDHSAQDAHLPVPAFTPVTRRKPRHDGWTADRQRAFIAALAETGSVSHAAARINMAKEGAYQLRMAPGADSFRKAWAAALDYGVQQLADLAIDRAREGVPVPVFYNGEQVGEKRAYNDRLLMFILRHHMPGKYGPALAGGTRSQATIEREAAENCPTCRAAREEVVDDKPSDEAEAWLDRVLKLYFGKVGQEHAERRAGRWQAADFFLRQLTHIELILDLGGRSGELITRFTSDPEGKKSNLYASDLSHHLAAQRAEIWAAAKAQPRPPVRLPRVLPSAGMWSGNTYAAREAARQACEARIAAAQDEWEAACEEATWRAWCEGR